MNSCRSLTWLQKLNRRFRYYQALGIYIYIYELNSPTNVSCFFFNNVIENDASW